MTYRIIGYHGTSSKNAEKIESMGVLVRCGGGELGQGFYVSDKLHVAKAWALHVSRTFKNNVVEFSIPEKSFWDLAPRLLDHLEALRFRNTIRKAGITRTFLFGENVIWAPIVGTTTLREDQFKFESTEAEDLMNGKSVLRSVR
jgi:hypothetical protein